MTKELGARIQEPGGRASRIANSRKQSERATRGARLRADAGRGQPQHVVVHKVDQPAREVVDFYQQQLSEQGLHIQSVNSGVAHVLVVTSSSKNAKINISSPSENQTVVQIAYEE